VADAAEQTNLFRKVVHTARAIREGFVDWFEEHGNRAGRVMAELGLAGVISGTLSYFAGVPPVMSFPVTVPLCLGRASGRQSRPLLQTRTKRTRVIEAEGEPQERKRQMKPSARKRA